VELDQVPSVIVPVLDSVVVRFLLTSSQPSYAIIMNSTLPESDRNLSYVDSTLGVVTNGTACNIDVRMSIHRHILLSCGVYIHTYVHMYDKSPVVYMYSVQINFVLHWYITF